MNKHEKLAEAIAEYNNIRHELDCTSFGRWIKARIAYQLDAEALQAVMDAAPDADTGESLEDQFRSFDIANAQRLKYLEERMEKLERIFEPIPNEPDKPTEEDLKHLVWLCQWKLIADVRRESLTRIYDYLNATL